MASVPPKNCWFGTPLADFDAQGATSANNLNYNLPASTAFFSRCLPVNVPTDRLKARLPPSLTGTAVLPPKESKPNPTRSLQPAESVVASRSGPGNQVAGGYAERANALQNVDGAFVQRHQVDLARLDTIGRHGLDPLR